jgi:hypothetical protein
VTGGSQRTWKLALFAASTSGYLVLTYVIAWGVSVGHFDIPSGDVLVWDRVGDQVRAGVSPYGVVLANPTDSFWYAPPVAVLFAATSWAPPTLLWAAIVVGEIVALRYVAGSWRAVGFIGWLPLTAFELMSGNFNLIVVAAIVAATRGRPGPAVWASLAKLSPVLAIHPFDWRPALRMGLLAVVITFPVLWLWPEWVTTLAKSTGISLGIQIPIPLAVRVVIAAGLLVIWRPWSRALAAAVAIPSFYYGSLILVLVLLADRRRGWIRRERSDGRRLVDRRRRR